MANLGTLAIRFGRRVVHVDPLLAELRGDVVCAELLDWRVEPATELIAERPRQPHKLSGVRLADAYTCALRGYAAVHCASAEQLNDGDLAMATGDWKLRDACIAGHGDR